MVPEAFRNHCAVEIFSEPAEVVVSCEVRNKQTGKIYQLKKTVGLQPIVDRIVNGLRANVQSSGLGRLPHINRTSKLSSPSDGGDGDGSDDVTSGDVLTMACGVATAHGVNQLYTEVTGMKGASTNPLSRSAMSYEGPLSEGSSAFHGNPLDSNGPIVSVGGWWSDAKAALHKFKGPIIDEASQLASQAATAALGPAAGPIVGNLTKDMIHSALGHGAATQRVADAKRIADANPNSAASHAYAMAQRAAEKTAMAYHNASKWSGRGWSYGRAVDHVRRGFRFA
jgi:hypothetical protein